ncbi:MAG: neutral zinc metallopeptidase [Prevotella sp.]|nr:neutral zinc metallopeptidase [Prevotella sp.]MBQ6658049.1 neutral zinc metallopeptidase [Prevotella sp.]MBQ7717087.1 neutral zinc metallopeptidase [Prevotella sp.]MBR0523800.1 neutral zinc metallopeptidase [Prevotella sp.]
MRLNGRRESNNVDDRRGMTGGTAAGLGIGGIVIIALMTFLGGGNIGDVINNVGQQMAQSQNVSTKDGEREFTEEEQALAKFSSQILAGTEDVWTKVFKQMGREYVPPKMVLYTSSVNTGCGTGNAQVGPFYCSADQCLYIDLSFFTTMKRNLGADGDFSYAYVIAHEVGHHVEYLLGILNKAHSAMSQYGQNSPRANAISVKLELLADYYAGVWAHYDDAQYNSLEPGDIEEAIDCAQKIGDNYLQEKARGYSQPESFTHGTSAQRMKWLKMGIEKGDMSISTFNVSDSEL